MLLVPLPYHPANLLNERRHSKNYPVVYPHMSSDSNVHVLFNRIDTSKVDHFLIGLEKLTTHQILAKGWQSIQETASFFDFSNDVSYEFDDFINQIIFDLDKSKQIKTKSYEQNFNNKSNGNNSNNNSNDNNNNNVSNNNNGRLSRRATEDTEGPNQPSNINETQSNQHDSYHSIIEKTSENMNDSNSLYNLELEIRENDIMNTYSRIHGHILSHNLVNSNKAQTKCCYIDHTININTSYQPKGINNEPKKNNIFPIQSNFNTSNQNATHLGRQNGNRDPTEDHTTPNRLIKTSNEGTLVSRIINSTSTFNKSNYLYNGNTVDDTLPQTDNSVMTRKQKKIICKNRREDAINPINASVLLTKTSNNNKNSFKPIFNFSHQLNELFNTNVSDAPIQPSIQNRNGVNM